RKSDTKPSISSLPTKRSHSGSPIFLSEFARKRPGAGSGDLANSAPIATESRQMIKDLSSAALCKLLGITYPIMSAGMNDCAGPELVAAVSDAGGLGSLGTGRANADYMRREIR